MADIRADAGSAGNHRGGVVAPAATGESARNGVLAALSPMEHRVARRVLRETQADHRLAHSHGRPSGESTAWFVETQRALADAIEAYEQTAWRRRWLPRRARGQEVRLVDWMAQRRAESDRITANYQSRDAGTL